MRPLQRLSDKSLADILDQGFLRRDVPVFSGEIVRRFSRPDIQHLIDRFKKHLVAVGIEISAQLSVRQKPAGANSEYQAPLESMIEHRDGCCDPRWVRG